VEREADGAVAQYTADLTVLDLTDPADPLAVDTAASVNHPGSAFGFKLYQNSMGDAATLTVRRDGETVQEEILCVGEHAALLDTPLALLLGSVIREGDAVGYGYQIYVGEELYDRNVQWEGESIQDFQPYQVSFSQARSYTLIQMKRDRFTPLALLGGLITLLGLFLAFYLQTCKLWAVREADGSWTLRGSSPKGGTLFAERLREAAREAETKQS